MSPEHDMYYVLPFRVTPKKKHEPQSIHRPDCIDHNIIVQVARVELVN